MTKVSIVSWRDIPAQVIAGKGRKAVKIQLSEKFEQAIDRCAMKTNLKDSDSYLSEWKKTVIEHDQTTELEAAERESKNLEEKFNAKTIKAYLDNNGWSPT